MSHSRYFKLSITALALTRFLVSEAGNTKSTRPNILFCLADDATYYHFSANGSRWVNTPVFDKVAKQGILFSNCYTANPKSGPSRSSILTGLYSWQSREAGNHNCNFPADLKVVTEALNENGYEIAYTGKGWAPGNPGKTQEGKSRELTGKAYQSKTLLPLTTEIDNNDYAANFADFLNHNNGEKPWFFWFGSWEPHRNYEYGSGENMGRKTKSMIDDFPLFWPDNDSVRTDMLDYGFEIEYFDSQIGRLINELEKRGILDNTIVIITSDNGMPFPRSKANNYEYSAHMPLAILWKNGISNPGRTVTDYVNFVDFTPTFLDVSGQSVEKSGLQTPAGHSLTTIFKSNKEGRVESERNFTISGRERDDYGRPQNQGYPIRSIFKDNFLYICNLKPNLYPVGNPETGYLDCDGSPTKSVILNLNRQHIDSTYWALNFGIRTEDELYDLTNDKFCFNSLATNDLSKIKMNDLKMELFAQLKLHKDPRMLGNGDVFDRYPYDNREKVAWNFWENVVSGIIKNPWEWTGWVLKTDYESNKSK